jgi:L-alanine-DL-glutamate epimerase-like enolase superfamily enzyme
MAAEVVVGRSALEIGGAHAAMRAALRNVGYPGLGAAAASAVDVALGDDAELYVDANGAYAAKQSLLLAAHTAPSIHAPALAAVPGLRHLEWFHDHVRIERRFLDGFLEPQRGSLRPDPQRPGLGVEPKWADLDDYAV